MTVSSLGKRRTNLERNAAEVIGMLTRNDRPADIARHFKVTANAVYLFQERHKAEIESALAAAVKQVTDYAIAHKVERIAGLDRLRTGLEAEIQANGMIDTDRHGMRSAPLVRELRATYHDAAEQLGQLPRPEVNVQTNVVLVRQVEGTAGDQLG